MNIIYITYIVIIIILILKLIYNICNLYKNSTIKYSDITNSNKLDELCMYIENFKPGFKYSEIKTNIPW